MQTRKTKKQLEGERNNSVFFFDKALKTAGSTRLADQTAGTRGREKSQIQGQAKLQRESTEREEKGKGEER